MVKTRMTGAPTTALIRTIPASFAEALAEVPAAIDVPLARTQHEAYASALEACGLTVRVLDADEACPDCCFVEDTAVVIDGIALIARPGAPSRRAEVEPVARALAAEHAVVYMAEPATLDGGDCMIVGRTLYVGRSARTNPAGIARLEDVFGDRGVRVVPIELPPGVLHLKCVCSPLGDDRILAAEGLPPSLYDLFDASIVWAPVAETYAANAVAVGNHVIVADGFPRTHAALRMAGFTLHPVATTEARKADGSLTCQSLIW